MPKAVLVSAEFFSWMVKGALSLLAAVSKFRSFSSLTAVPSLSVMSATSVSPESLMTPRLSNPSRSEDGLVVGRGKSHLPLDHSMQANIWRESQTKKKKEECSDK